MRLLIAVLVCLPPALCLPVGRIVPRASSSTWGIAYRPSRSPQHFAQNFQIPDFSEPIGFSGFGSENEIPIETRDKFIPPDPPTKEGRHRKYFAFATFENPPHAHAILHDEPFFDTFDHGKAVLSLVKRRKRMHLNPHLLKSLRPYFPFFSPH